MFNDKSERAYLQKPTLFFVSEQRKDGRYLVQFNFLNKTIRKIHTLEAVNELRNNPSYREGRKF